MATMYNFFKFDHKDAQSDTWQRTFKRIREESAFYMLTRFDVHWELRIPVVNSGLSKYITYDSLAMYQLFKTKGFRRPFKLEDLLLLLKDLRATWGDYPLHTRVGYNRDTGFITELVTDEDPMVITLAYSDRAC